MLIESMSPRLLEITQMPICTSAQNDNIEPAASNGATTPRRKFFLSGKGPVDTLGTLLTIAVAGAALIVSMLISPSAEARPRLPEIRMHAGNQVPACVTPERLMAYMHSRNKNRKIRRMYKDIAYYFKLHGEKYKVRWDYAFFQSMLETNFLTYRTGSGRWGDVSLKQYNFAGIGTTGGGVPGNGFKNTSEGVLAQIQHLIAYSGEYQKNPTAPRTRLKQREIIRLSRKLRRPVRFDDLAGRWAVDKRYANSIEWVAKRFRKKYCTGRMLQVAEREARKKKQRLAAKRAADKAKRARELAAYRARQDAKERQAQAIRTAALAAEKRKIRAARSRALAQRAIAEGQRNGNNRLSALGAANLAAFRNAMPDARSSQVLTAGAATVPFAAIPRPKPIKRCAVMTASYGGKKALLIKTSTRRKTTYTALGVRAGFEESMAASYIKDYAKGGKTIGKFGSEKDALRKAFTLCPERLASR